ncbi:MAG: GNAT family N-acetyltransferase [Adhaeribacter sp.]
MKVEQINNGKKGFFMATENNAEAGMMVYTWAGDTKIIIEHTEVNPAFKGQGVGQEMLLSAVKYARENHIKILPLCPFARSVFEKNEELQDVLF